MHRRPARRPAFWFLVALAVAGGGIAAAAPPPVPPPEPLLRMVLAVDAPVGSAEALPPPGADAVDPDSRRHQRRAAAVRRLEAEGRARLAPVESALRPLVDGGDVRILARFPAFGMLAVSVAPRRVAALHAAPGLRDLWPVARRRLASAPAAAENRTTGGDAEGGSAPLALGLSPAPRADHLGRIGAPAAWNRLGGLGEGLVIGIIDSGADGRHPILAANFRGRRERRLDHDWLDLTLEHSRDPVDGNGHGTHVTGLAVGVDGDQAWGAAPGARWIAARAFDAEGNTDDLTLLAAADWMLHPGGAALPSDPSQAPDIVNMSWTLDNGADDRFRPVIQAFVHADILPVCATGNLEDLRDPWPRLLAPASYPEALAVGALSRGDQPWLWGRLGPGFYGGVKPQLLAPGEALWSALPDGETGSFSGSSMAAPLVAGAAAVIWGQAPGLRAAEVAAILSASAQALEPPGADSEAGPGRLDLAAAVDLARRTGWVEGRVKPGLGPDGRGRPGAAVTLEAPATWPPAWKAWLGRATADAGGGFRLVAPAGSYRLRVSHPLDQPWEAQVTVSEGRGTRVDPRPADVALIAFQGRVHDSFGAPLAGVRIGLSAPDATEDPFVETTSAADGSFSQRAPAGAWRLRAAAEAQRVLTGTLVLAAGTERSLDLELAPAPRTLLVDADAWDDERIAPYLGRALDDAGLPRSRWDILAPTDLPSAARLAAADLLWWAHTYQSPGRLDQERRDQATVQGLSAFMAGGGQLLLSGQDVALWDQKRGLARDFFARAVGSRQSRDRVAGLPTGLRGTDVLDGLILDAAWAGGAAKTRYAQPDSLDLDGADPAVRTLLRWSDGSAGAVARSGDEAFPGRRAFLAFGPEGAGGRLALARVVDRLARWMTPPGLLLEPAADAIAPGQALTMTLRLRGGGDAQDVAASLDWPSALRLESPGGLLPEGTTRAAWQGRLAAAEERRFDVRLRLAGPLTGALDLPLEALLRAAGRTRRGAALLRPQVPDLRASRLAVLPARLPQGGGTASLSLILVNDGPVAAATALFTVPVPLGLVVDPGSLRASAGLAALDPQERRVTWRGDLAAGASVSVAWQAAVPAGPAQYSWLGTVAVPGMADLPLAAEQRVGGPRLRLAHVEPLHAELAAGAILDLGLALANDGLSVDSATVTVRALGADAAEWAFLDPPTGRWTGAVPAGGTVGIPLRVRAPAAPREAEAGLLVTLDDGLFPSAPVTATVDIALRWPDLGTSDATSEPDLLAAGDLVSVTLRLTNSGNWPAEARALDLLPPSMVPLPQGLSISSGTVDRQPGQLLWRCTVAAGAQETLRYSARAGGSTDPNRVLTHTVRIEGGREPVVLNPALRLNPWSWSAELSSWPPGAPPGGAVEQRLDLRGEGLSPPRAVSVAVDLPRALEVDRQSLPPDLVLEQDGHALRYEGALGTDGTLRLLWRSRVAPGLESGGQLFTGARISASGMPTLALAHRLAVSATDWSRSSLGASRLLLQGVQQTELRLLLDNAGPRADRAELSMAIPPALEPDPASLATDGGAPAAWDPGARRLTWQGEVTAGARLTIRLSARRDPVALPPDQAIPLTMAFVDGRGIRYLRDLTLAAPRVRVGLPWLALERP